LAEELIVSFDNDTAGMEAAERAIQLAEANDFAVKVASFPKQFKDAADAAQADPTNVRRAVEGAVPAPRFYFDKYLSLDGVDGAGGAGESLAKRLKTREGLRALRAVLAKLKNISSPVERQSWFKELEVRTGIPERTLEEEANKVELASPLPAAVRTPGDAAEKVKREISRANLIAEELFAAALTKNDFSMLDECADFLGPVQKEILRILKSGKRKSEDPALDEAIGLIVLRASGDLSHEEIANLKAELKKEFYKERRTILAQAIKNAEARKNDAELAAALTAKRSHSPSSRRSSKSTAARSTSSSSADGRAAS